MRNHGRRVLVPAIMLLIAAMLLSGCQKKDVILATTTSTRDSGLLDVLIPMFEKDTGYRIKMVAVGTGQALALGEKGEADVLLVHAPEAEKAAVDAGYATNRLLVMHNDFIIVGPSDDPAGIKDEELVAGAFKKIAESKSTFVSRGDDSGTHKKELEIWKAAEVETEGLAEASDAWYLETGAGMAQTLKVGNEKNGYVLTDRATYLNLKDTLELEILFEGDTPLLNIYHVMQVNPEKFPKINAKGGKAFAEFMVSEKAQKAIGEYGKDKFGQPLFFPDAGKPEF